MGKSKEGAARSTGCLKMPERSVHHARGADPITSFGHPHQCMSPSCLPACCLQSSTVWISIQFLNSDTAKIVRLCLGCLQAGLRLQEVSALRAHAPGAGGGRLSRTPETLSEAQLGSNPWPYLVFGLFRVLLNPSADVVEHS
jgi:hypothetical protein